MPKPQNTAPQDTPDKATAGIAQTPKRGAPSKYTPELANTICEQLINGDSLAKVCKNPEMPHIGTVMRWVNTHPSFREDYARATEMRGDVYVERILDVCDEPAEDMITVNKQRLTIDSLKWTAGRMNPRRWGDRVGLDVQAEITQVNQGDTLAIARSILDVLATANMAGSGNECGISDNAVLDLQAITSTCDDSVADGASAEPDETTD